MMRKVFGKRRSKDIPYEVVAEPPSAIRVHLGPYDQDKDPEQPELKEPRPFDAEADGHLMSAVDKDPQTYTATVYSHAGNLAARGLVAIGFGELGPQTPEQQIKTGSRVMRALELATASTITIGIISEIDPNIPSDILSRF